MDNFQRSAQEAGRCYTMGSPSAYTIITRSIEKKLIDLLDFVFRVHERLYWYYYSDLHENHSVLSQH